MQRQILKLMVLSTLTAKVLSTFTAISRALNETSSLTTPFLVKQHGYPIEEHTVQTTDGYILTMHRIPYSPKLNNINSQRPVAFLMHGFVCASSGWVLSGPKRSLAYILSDAGFDVWMGNARGNVYSKKHAFLNTSTQAFWNFDWHEIGIYDQPAMIDYALKVSGEEKVRFIGQSQGGTTFLVMNSMLPSYVKDHIRSAHLMAPVALLNHPPNILVELFGPLLGQPNPIVEIIGSIEILPNLRAAQLLTEQMCKDGAIFQFVCSDILLYITGGNSPYINRTQLPEILAIIPAGASINQLFHYMQAYTSGRFRQFDYGLLRNLLVYGSLNPPDYNLGNLNVPTYLYYSDADRLANLINTKQLIDALSENAAFKGSFYVPLIGWNHLDFLFGLGVENVLYSVVLNDIANS